MLARLLDATWAEPSIRVRWPSPALSRTQEAILAAYAELIEELGTDDVSFRLDRAPGGRRRAHGLPQLSDAGRSAARDRGVDRGDGCSPARSRPRIFDMPLTIRDAMESYDPRPELAHVVAETTMRGISGAAPSPAPGACSSG